MDIEELRDKLDELRPDDLEEPMGFEQMVVQTGQAAKAAIMLEGRENDFVQEKKDSIHRELFARMLVAALEFAYEHDIDIEKAVEDHLDKMQQQLDMQKAIEEGSARDLAEAMGAQQNEVPTGNEGDEDDPRYIN